MNSIKSGMDKQARPARNGLTACSLLRCPRRLTAAKKKNTQTHWGNKEGRKGDINAFANKTRKRRKKGAKIETTRWIYGSFQWVLGQWEKFSPGEMRLSNTRTDRQTDKLWLFTRSASSQSAWPGCENGFIAEHFLEKLAKMFGAIMGNIINFTAPDSG